MKDVLTDVFDRFLAPLREGGHGCLRLGNVGPVEQISE